MYSLQIIKYQILIEIVFYPIEYFINKYFRIEFGLMNQFNQINKEINFN